MSSCSWNHTVCRAFKTRKIKTFVKSLPIWKRCLFIHWIFLHHRLMLNLALCSWLFLAFVQLTYFALSFVKAQIVDFLFKNTGSLFASHLSDFNTNIRQILVLCIHTFYSCIFLKWIFKTRNKGCVLIRFCRVKPLAEESLYMFIQMMALSRNGLSFPQLRPHASCVIVLEWILVIISSDKFVTWCLT